MTEQTVSANEILVIVPTLNEEPYIEACIRSLIDGDADMKDVMVMVMDGGSSDRTVEIVERMTDEFPNLSCRSNPRRIQSAAINIAAQTAPVERTILVRCDAHSVYPQGFVKKVAGALKRVGSASVVVPMDAVASKGCFQAANAWIVDSPLGSGGSAHRGGDHSGYIDHGHHAAFDRAVYLELGGYDEAFTHNEDAEYDYRVNASGRKVWMEADARIHYVPRDSFRGLWKQYFNYGKGRAKNQKKHKSRLRLRQVVPLINFLGLVGSAFGALIWAGVGPQEGWLKWLGFAALAFQPALYLSALSMVSLVGAAKMKSVCGLFAGVVLACMHNSWAIGFLKGYLLTPTPRRDLEALHLAGRTQS